MLVVLKMERNRLSAELLEPIKKQTSYIPVWPNVMFSVFPSGSVSSVVCVGSSKHAVQTVCFLLDLLEKIWRPEDPHSTRGSSESWLCKSLSTQSAHWKHFPVCSFPDSSSCVQESGPRAHMTRQEVQGMSPFTRNEGRAKLLAKNRQTFILQTTKLTRVARRVCEDILQPRRAARRPYAPINANAVKAECMYSWNVWHTWTLP